MIYLSAFCLTILLSFVVGYKADAIETLFVIPILAFIGFIITFIAAIYNEMTKD